MTRLSSSSPVTAATTSALSTCASASRVASHASAWSHGHAGGLVGPLGRAHDGRVVVHDEHVVPGLVQLLGDEPPDAAAAGDDHSHQCPPLAGPAASNPSTASSASLATVR